MAASKIPEPVMHVKSDDFDGVLTLGNHLKDDGLYANSADFPTPPVTGTVFGDELIKFTKAIAAAPGNTANIKIRDKQSVYVHGLIKQNLLYVKPICNGNYELIKKSGFEPSIIPTAHTLAPQAVIKKIVKGPGTNTIKVMLSAIEGLEQFKKENRSYIVMVYDAAGAVLIRTGCVSTNSRKLLVHDVPFSTQFYYAVAIQNAAGINEPSAKMRYTLTDS